VSILGDLARQRETIVHARDTLHGADDNISKARRLLSTMSKRVMANKIIMFGIRCGGEGRRAGGARRGAAGSRTPQPAGARRRACGSDLAAAPAQPPPYAPPPPPSALPPPSACLLLGIILIIYYRVKG
jgi:hypothetical protein